MIKKLIITYRINKFYSIFWELLDYTHKVRAKDMSLDDVAYDINEVLDYIVYENDEMYGWLNKLLDSVANLRDKR